MEIKEITTEMSKELQDFINHQEFLKEEMFNSMGIPKELLVNREPVRQGILKKIIKSVMEYIYLLAARASTLISNACTRFREHCP